MIQPFTGRGPLSLFGVAVLLSVVAAFFFWRPLAGPPQWSESEKGIIASMRLQNLPELPPDPSNAVADDPRATELGHRLFFDTRLSGNNAVACSSCHQPDRQFTDGLALARAIGESRRNTPSIIGTAYSPWLYWDGRKDSQWAQALSPLEDASEHGGNRLHYVHLITTDPVYRQGYAELFGKVPDFSDRTRFPADAGPVSKPEWSTAWQSMSEQDREQVNLAFANIGKLIAAYERILMPGLTRFDLYAEAVISGRGAAEQEIFSPDEIRGLRLFINEARCTECHNGPLLTNNEFHNTGLLPPSGQIPDRGRSSIIIDIISDPFNCLGRYSDADNGQCLELTFMRTGAELIGAMRTPSLRNLEQTAPFMHKGQMETLSEVLQHYNEAPPALIGHNEAEPLGLSDRELDQIEAFLNTLNAPPAIEQRWLSPPESGYDNSTRQLSP